MLYIQHDPLSPPPLHNLHTVEIPYLDLYLFTQGREGEGGGKWTSEKVRGTIGHQTGRKYQHE